jgi:hypothetical protein
MASVGCREVIRFLASLLLTLVAVEGGGSGVD